MLCFVIEGVKEQLESVIGQHIFSVQKVQPKVNCTEQINLSVHTLYVHCMLHCEAHCVVRVGHTAW